MVPHLAQPSVEMRLSSGIGAKTGAQTVGPRNTSGFAFAEHARQLPGTVHPLPVAIDGVSPEVPGLPVTVIVAVTDGSAV
jgi:hypothetical protein